MILLVQSVSAKEYQFVPIAFAHAPRPCLSLLSLALSLFLCPPGPFLDRSVLPSSGKVPLLGPPPAHGVVLRGHRLPRHLPVLPGPDVGPRRRVRQLPPTAAALENPQGRDAEGGGILSAPIVNGHMQCFLWWFQVLFSCCSVFDHLFAVVLLAKGPREFMIYLCAYVMRCPRRFRGFVRSLSAPPPPSPPSHPFVGPT